MCNEYIRLGRFNIGKQVEYGNLYIGCSHLFDASLVLLNILHTATLSEQVCRAVALST